MRPLSALPLTIILLAFVTTARVRGPYDDERTSVGWAWKQIRNGQIADFDVRCGTLNPRAKDGWNDCCRLIRPDF